MKIIEPNKGNILIYKTKNGKTSLRVKLQEETVWLTQKQMADLFRKSRVTITEHISNVFKERELEEKSVCREFRHTANDGKTYTVQYYNLDVIISIGYRVKSKQGTQFRIWATHVLKDHIIKGYTLNTKRLRETNLEELEHALQLIHETLTSKQLTNDETTGLLKIITDYAHTWVLLQKYDKNQLETPKKKHPPTYILTYEQAQEAIMELKTELSLRKEASEFFGQERDHYLKNILGNLYQTFDGEELYKSIEEKAAHLLYFVIKDHPFVDGNKRSGAFLFILFLSRNRCLLQANGEKKLNDNALAALTLLVAESNPKQKDTIIKLIMNFIGE